MFAGFTPAPIAADLGREQMHASCDAAFGGSHLCHVAEYHLATSATPVPAAGAWVDSSGATDGSFSGAVVVEEIASREAGRYTGRLLFGNCDNWSTTSSSLGLVLKPGGAFGESCGVPRVLACCATPYRERFRGFTTATTTGAAGGRAQMHLQCAQQFPGSHLCHVAEYHRAAPSITPPAPGAWIDPSGFATASGGVVETRLASIRVGRWTARAVIGPSHNCQNWTELGAEGQQGLTVQPGGSFNASCSIARPLACCE